jgi:hypothetical protein
VRPLCFFFAFFDEDLLDMIHFQTNWKSVQKGKPASVTKNEIKVFIGINIVMGYNGRNQLRHYWSSSQDMGVSIIQAAMSCDHFIEILGCLHLNDNAKLNEIIFHSK